MQFTHIASLLREALVISGCTDAQIGSFDGHSTIELKLEDLPALNISVLDNGLWFWSALVEVGDMLLAHRSEALLHFLMQGWAFARTEQMQLVKANGLLEVRVLLADSAFVDAKALANTLDIYLVALTALCDLIHR